ncbi:MAG: DNA translocase FtsK [Bacteroides sp.]|nr:DNA translocase FtsK [Bacteroides sp.]MCM1380146.1 DNA translocase FtsK [Bacteroides sp.]MCM1445732.1 DNA translocase FtsK [Prevotella sp.]
MSNYYDPYANEVDEQPTVEPRPSQPAAASAPRKPRAKTPDKKSAKRKKQSEPLQLPAWLTNENVKMFFGIVVLLFAAYSLIAAISMIMTSGADQTLLQNMSPEEIRASGREVSNIAGPAGAWIGKVLLTNTLGVGSFVLIFYMMMIGLKLVGMSNVRVLPLTLKCLVLAISLSIIVGLITFAVSAPIVYGGFHGYYVNRWLIDIASPIGAICVSIALASLVILIFSAQIGKAIAKIREYYERKHRDVQVNDEPQPSQSLEEYTPVEEEDSIKEEQDINEYFDPADDDDQPEVAPAEPAEPFEEEFEVVANEIEEADHIQTDTYDPTAELSRYHFPPLDLLEDRTGSKVTVDTEEQEANKQRIIDALAQFNIQISSIKATVGPTITLFEVVPAPGQRIAAIKRVEEDLALALKALGIRIIAPIPGKGTIGIEVPNSDPQVVSMRSIIASKKFQECKYELPMALGATISNEVFIADLAKAPHLLVAGATGQGKSVGLNAIITSLLYKKHPAELKFVLVDPKSVEFSLYRVLEKHYLAKLPDEEEAVITESNKVIATLNSLCVEMDNRYTLLKNAGCRTLMEYNSKFTARRLNPEKGHRYLPYIVLIIDEFADLIMTAGKEIETPLCRIAQKARAVGIHAIIATQRPSTNVVTGLIKAQFPARIAFRVAQMVDSKTILDRSGAHQLVGKGDMFFSTNGNMVRVQCAFVDTPEVDAICQYISEQQGYPIAYELPEYVPDLMGGSDVPLGGGGAYGVGNDRDPLLEEAARFLVSSGNTASTSSLQRRFGIGYNRAGKLMDQLEAAGIVGPVNGSKPRNILVDIMTLDSMF